MGDFAGHRPPRPAPAASLSWVVAHLPLTAAIAAMGAAMVGLIEHAHEGRTPAAVAWTLCGGAAVVLVTTMLVAASLTACLAAAALRPAPLVLGLVLVALISVPWTVAVTRKLAPRAPGSGDRRSGTTAR